MGKVLRFSNTGNFSPEQTYAMGAAFEFANDHSKHKQLNGALSDTMRDFIAQCIIEMAERGENDPQKMADDALALLDRRCANG